MYCKDNLLMYLLNNPIATYSIMNKYVVYKSENSTLSLSRSYNDDWYTMVEDPKVPVGFRILVVDSNHDENLQRNITEHQGNNVWTRMCFLYTKDDPTPEFHRNGRLWSKQQDAAMKGIYSRFTAAENYANRKFNNNSSMFFLDLDHCTGNEEFNVPGKVEWEYDKLKPDTSDDSFPTTPLSLLEEEKSYFDFGNIPPLTPYDKQPMRILDLLSEEEKMELPMFEVQHGFKTRSYRVDEPIAFTPGVLSNAFYKYYEKIRENLIIEYFNKKDKI